jgi:hypothetical protein
MSSRYSFKQIEGALRSFDGQSDKAIASRADHIVREVSYAFFEELNTPFSLRCSILLRYGEYKQLVDSKAVIHGNNTHEDIAAEAWLAKYKGFTHSDLDPEAEARRQFNDAEQRCRVTNHRVRSYLKSENDEDSSLLASLRRIQETIYAVLGEFSPGEWLEKSGFGPGVNAGVETRGATSPYHKMLAGPIFSGPDLQFAQGLLKHVPGWADASAKPVKAALGDELDFVDKNAKTKRSILITCALNLYFQKGIGAMIRHRMKRIGIDLSGNKTSEGEPFGGQLFHRKMARMASRSWSHLATVDLKAASDTIAIAVVRALFPPRWYSAMASVSARQYIPRKGERVPTRLHKFAAMGNGFTFELESLLFYAITKEALRGTRSDITDLTVYGDDIIMPSIGIPRFLILCDFLGFQVNEDKTHITGKFRESCGGNYYDGEEVVTLYWKEPVTGMQSLYGLTNRVRARANSATNARVRRAYAGAADRLRSYVPRPARVVRYPEILGVLDYGLAEPIDLFEVTGYDKDLQKQVYSSYTWAAVTTEVVMDNLWSAKAHLLYSVEDGNKDYNPVKYRLFGRAAQSLKLGKGGKIIRSVAYGNGSVPIRGGPVVSKLRRTSYYIEDFAVRAP